MEEDPAPLYMWIEPDPKGCIGLNAKSLEEDDELSRVYHLGLVVGHDSKNEVYPVLRL